MRKCHQLSQRKARVFTRIGSRPLLLTRRPGTSLMRGIAIATLAVAIVAGIGLAYSTGISNTNTFSATTATATQSTNQNRTSSSSNPTAPPSVSQSCKLPLISTNSSSGISMTISNPRCGYFTSTNSYGGGIRMVSNETLAVEIHGPPSTTVF